MAVSAYDEIAVELQQLRLQAGDVSYGEIARRIAQQRIAAGVSEAAATVPRSTIYSLFKTGRVRIDIKLLHETVLALGLEEAEAEHWKQRAIAAKQRQATQQNLTAAQSVAPPISAPPAPAPAVTPIMAAPAMAPAASAPPTTVKPSAPAQGANRRRTLLVVLCIALNLAGLVVANTFKLTVYLDMVGTAVAALILGPWHAVVVAISSSLLGVVTGDPITPYFAPVNVVGALVWGYGARLLGPTLSPARFAGLNVLAAIACSAVAAPIVLLVFDAANPHASMQAQESLIAAGLAAWFAVFSTNLVTSVIDKLVTGTVALLALLTTRQYFHSPIVVTVGEVATDATLFSDSSS